MSLKLHPRKEIVQKAKKDFFKFYVNWQDKYNLTLIEEMQIWNGEIASGLKYALQLERQISPEKLK